MSKQGKTIVAVLAFIVVIIAIIFVVRQGRETTPSAYTPPTETPSTPASDTTSDGTISFSRPADFGLAVTMEQIPVSSYIPPCIEFTYCLYYSGAAYVGSNFESAGLSILNRSSGPDFSTQTACLTIQPDGYSGLSPKIAHHTDYAIGVFAPIGDAAAGHYANGEEYRLFTDGKCYQFDIRIGETQFANYPAGTIKEFTASQRTALLAQLRSMVSGIKLVKSSSTLVLPQ